RVDVLAVEGRDERRVEALKDRVDDLVAPSLAGGDLLVQRLVGGVGEQVPQAAGAVGDVGRRVVEQGEEGVVGGDQAEAHSSGSGGEVGDTFDGGHGAGRAGAGGRREGRARRPRPATGVVPAGDG